MCSYTVWKQCHNVFNLLTKLYVLYRVLSMDGTSSQFILCHMMITSRKYITDNYRIWHDNIFIPSNLMSLRDRRDWSSLYITNIDVQETVSVICSLSSNAWFSFSSGSQSYHNSGIFGTQSTLFLRFFRSKYMLLHLVVRTVHALAVLYNRSVKCSTHSVSHSWAWYS